MRGEDGVRVEVKGGLARIILSVGWHKWLRLESDECRHIWSSVTPVRAPRQERASVKCGPA